MSTQIPFPLSPSDTETCLKLTSDPVQHVCYPVSDVATAPAEHGPGLHLWLGGSDVQDAQDTLGDLANAPADPADAQKLHDLIYPGLDAAQIAGIVAAVIITLAILAAVIVARRRSADGADQ